MSDRRRFIERLGSPHGSELLARSAFELTISARSLHLSGAPGPTSSRPLLGVNEAIHLISMQLYRGLVADEGYSPQGLLLEIESRAARYGCSTQVLQALSRALLHEEQRSSRGNVQARDM